MTDVNISPQYVPHYSNSGAIDHLYRTGFYDVDIYGGKYRGANLTFDELKDFISFFVSDEHYEQIFGVEE